MDYKNGGGAGRGYGGDGSMHRPYPDSSDKANRGFARQGNQGRRNRDGPQNGHNQQGQQYGQQSRHMSGYGAGAAGPGGQSSGGSGGVTQRDAGAGSQSGPNADPGQYEAHGAQTAVAPRPTQSSSSGQQVPAPVPAPYSSQTGPSAGPAGMQVEGSGRPGAAAHVAGQDGQQAAQGQTQQAQQNSSMQLQLMVGPDGRYWLVPVAGAEGQGQAQGQAEMPGQAYGGAGAMPQPPVMPPPQALAHMQAQAYGQVAQDSGSAEGMSRTGGQTTDRPALTASFISGQVQGSDLGTTIVPGRGSSHSAAQGSTGQGSVAQHTGASATPSSTSTGASVQQAHGQVQTQGSPQQHLGLGATGVPSDVLWAAAAASSGNGAMGASMRQYQAGQGGMGMGEGMPQVMAMGYQNGQAVPMGMQTVSLVPAQSLGHSGQGMGQSMGQGMHMSSGSYGPGTPFIQGVAGAVMGMDGSSTGLNGAAATFQPSTMPGMSMGMGMQSPQTMQTMAMGNMGQVAQGEQVVSMAQLQQMMAQAQMMQGGQSQFQSQGAMRGQSQEGVQTMSYGMAQQQQQQQQQQAGGQYERSRAVSMGYYEQGNGQSNGPQGYGPDDGYYGQGQGQWQDGGYGRGGYDDDQYQYYGDDGGWGEGYGQRGPYGQQSYGYGPGPRSVGPYSMGPGSAQPQSAPGSLPGSGPGSLAGDLPRGYAREQRAARYRTKLCIFWLNGNGQPGVCPYGERCFYAHGSHELRARDPATGMWSAPTLQAMAMRANVTGQGPEGPAAQGQGQAEQQQMARQGAVAAQRRPQQGSTSTVQPAPQAQTQAQGKGQAQVKKGKVQAPVAGTISSTSTTAVVAKAVKPGEATAANAPPSAAVAAPEASKLPPVAEGAPATAANAPAPVSALPATVAPASAGAAGAAPEAAAVKSLGPPRPSFSASLLGSRGPLAQALASLGPAVAGGGLEQPTLQGGGQISPRTSTAGRAGNNTSGSGGSGGSLTTTPRGTGRRDSLGLEGDGYAGPALVVGKVAGSGKPSEGTAAAVSGLLPPSLAFPAKPAAGGQAKGSAAGPLVSPGVNSVGGSGGLPSVTSVASGVRGGVQANTSGQRQRPVSHAAGQWGDGPTTPYSHLSSGSHVWSSEPGLGRRRTSNRGPASPGASTPGSVTSHDSRSHKLCHSWVLGRGQPGSCRAGDACPFSHAPLVVTPVGVMKARSAARLVAQGWDPTVIGPQEGGAAGAAITPSPVSARAPGAGPLSALSAVQGGQDLAMSVGKR